MLNFFKKRIEIVPYDFSCIARDIHSHLLPGIDDGSPDVATSVQLLKALGAAGINRFICTPHIIGDLYRNTPETIHNALGILQNACDREGLDVELNAAAEYMLDDYFMELLRKKKPLLTLVKNYILTEFSYATPPNNTEEIAFELNVNGYQPLMAHPERYFYYHRNYDAYARMKELGFLLQVNLLSLAGYYGKSVAKAAEFIIANGLADFVGTDLHHMKHLNALTHPRSKEIFQKVLGDKIYNTFE
ncbi:MAG: CpsB/CapC family capsule biosynthesis tyrosine phosphatase [Ginsengibacter sp.]